jgi:hypothetical protein
MDNISYLLSLPVQDNKFLLLLHQFFTHLLHLGLSGVEFTDTGLVHLPLLLEFRLSAVKIHFEKLHQLEVRAGSYIIVATLSLEVALG